MIFFFFFYQSVLWLHVSPFVQQLKPGLNKFMQDKTKPSLAANLQEKGNNITRYLKGLAEIKMSISCYCIYTYVNTELNTAMFNHLPGVKWDLKPRVSMIRRSMWPADGHGEEMPRDMRWISEYPWQLGEAGLVYTRSWLSQ